MAITNFIPTIWSARLEMALRKNLVYAAACNRNYEGDIGDKGDKVKIVMISDPEIKDYARNSDIDGPEELSDAATMLEVDQGKYFNFSVDDVDKRQSSPAVVDEAMSRAAYKLRDVADQFVASRMAAGVSSGNFVGSSGSPKTITSANESYDYLVDLKTELDEADVPSEGRWAIIPPWFQGLLLKKEEFVSFGTAQTDARLMNGQIGMAAGFMIVLSNNVPNSGGVFQVVAGVSQATTYADQIVKMEAYRPERRFSDAVKGLHVYGAKVIRPEMLAKLFVTRP
jgi:N4-gp56 family major capsid protein